MIRSCVIWPICGLTNQLLLNKTTKISIMTPFWWRHLKYVIKMTSQKFPFSSPSPLNKSWLRPLIQLNLGLGLMNMPGWSSGEHACIVCWVQILGLTNLTPYCKTSMQGAATLVLCCRDWASETRYTEMSTETRYTLRRNTLRFSFPNTFYML